MDRLYIMPIIGSGSSRLDPRRPKYLTNFGSLSSVMMDYGLEPVCLVAVFGIDQTLHDTLAALSDVQQLPENLDQQIGGAAANARDFIEATFNIPTGWLQASDTYRNALRVIAGMFQFMQAFQGAGGGRLLSGGVTLNTRFNQLPQATRQQMQAAATAMNFDTSSLTGASTLRQIFKAMSDQWGERPFIMGTLTI